MLLLWLVAAPVWAQAVSPGPLARAHEKLDGEGRCSKCHEEGKGVTDQRCLACHEEAKTSRFHSQLARESGKACAGCHRDHQGRDFPMVRWKPPQPFDHARTGWTLGGKHARTECRSCHQLPGHWMGLRSACSGCHKDPHAPSLGSRCQDCHDDKAFAPAPRFDHARARFALTGRHGVVTCKACHGSGERARYRELSFGKCSTCHKDPTPDHSGGQDCAACHTTAGWGQVGSEAGRKLHDRTRLPLQGRHAQIACARCHTQAQKALPGTTGKVVYGQVNPACSTCHAEPHQGRFGTACQACHGAVDWRMLPGARFDHGRTRWPLLGQHQRAACADCHGGKGAYKQRFRGRDGDRCSDCHSDPHGGPFASVPGGDRCETCHEVQGFRPSAFQVEDHERAGFRLDGSHRVVPCQDCHPRTDGRPARLHGTPGTCSACHRDPHAGQFDPPGIGAAGKPMSSQGISGKVDRCRDCHDTLQFQPARVDHRGYPLVGAHAKAPCTGCHQRPAEGAPVRFAGTATACATCHRDPHGGQFTSEPARGCQDCHGGPQTFRIAAFDHAATRFALEGRHAQAQCVACHPAVQAPDGKDRVLWRLGPQACEACHANPHTSRGAP